MAVVISYIDNDAPDFGERSIIMKNWTVANLFDDLCTIYADDDELTREITKARLFGSINFGRMDIDLGKKAVHAIRFVATESLNDSPSVNLPNLEDIKLKDTKGEGNAEFYLNSVTIILEFLEKETTLQWGDDYLVDLESS